MAAGEGIATLYIVTLYEDWDRPEQAVAYKELLPGGEGR